MIIVVRCMTCGHDLADKWDYYQRKLDERRREKIDDIEADKSKKTAKDKFFDAPFSKDILDELGLTRQCCRRHFLGHVDLIETI